MNRSARNWLLVAWTCGLLGCDIKQPNGSSSAAGTQDVRSNEIAWPQVEGFDREELHKFDDPRLGYSIAYNSPGGLAVTVFVYDKGIADIPDGASEVGRAELVKASDDITEAQRRGMWKSVAGGQLKKAQIGSGVGSPTAWAASFRLEHTDGEALSDLFVTGRRAKFIKVRCTYPAERKVECERDRERLLNALGVALSS